MNKTVVGYLLWLVTLVVVFLFLFHNFFPFVPFGGYEAIKWIFGAILACVIFLFLESRRGCLAKGGYLIPSREISFLGSILFGWLICGATIGGVYLLNHFFLGGASPVCVKVVDNEIAPDGLWKRVSKITLIIPGFDSYRVIRYRKSNIDMSEFKGGEFVLVELSKGLFAYEVVGVLDGGCEK